MRPLRAFVLKLVAIAPLTGVVFVLGCQGPDEFLRLSDAGMTGAAGTSPTGTGGSVGAGGNASGTAGAGGGPSGVAGTSGVPAGGGGSTSDGGVIPTGTAGTTGAAGTSAAGGRAGTSGARGGTTGAGGAPGTAGAAGGRSGTNGAGGTTGAAGTTAAGGRAGAGGGRGGTTGAAGMTGAVDPIQVKALCQADFAPQEIKSAQEIKVTFKILNPGSLAKQWSDIKIRYYFTPTEQTPPSVTFDYLARFPSTSLTTNATTSYVEIGFTSAAGSVSGFDNVNGSGDIQLRLYNYATTTWNTVYTDDYSYKSCAGVADPALPTERLTMPGYYQGQLVWGAEPGSGAPGVP